MKKKLAAFLLALIMVAQVLVPGTSWAIRDSEYTSQPSNNFVQVGMTSAENYPKLTNRVILDIQREATQKARENMEEKDGVTTFNTPYLPGQNISDKDKPRIVGKVSADFKTKGLDGGTFDWKGVFGTDSNGNPGKAKLVFKQWLNNQETAVSYELEVSEDGTYSWKDWEGQPARIPLYSKGLQPYTYSVYLDQDVSEKVKLLTYRIAGTPGSAGYEKDPETGLNVANIVIDLSIQQVASTKFVSKWYTNLEEKSRPPVNGEFNNKIDGYPGYFPFSTKDGGSIIIRNDKMYNSDYEDPGYSEYNSSKLVKTPEVKVTEGLEYADENDETGSPTYNIDEASKTITTLDKKHKFKYDFTYDVINGGKLTMTEIIPVTFDANGGKFANFTAPDTETKIVKEVDYDGTLTDKAENPTKDLETFKGWSETKGGTTPVSDDFFKNLKEAKTLYAIWDNNEIQAKELTVKESLKDEKGYINDFVPSMDDLQALVKIKDGSGTLKPIDSTIQGFDILDDYGRPIKKPIYKDYLYEKLKEDPNTEVSRIVEIEVQVTFKNGKEPKKVKIPIKVIKNIYEAKTEEGKPNYVPKDYVKVTVDPTTKAADPQKYFYYVNKEAKVVIPGENPKGTNGNTFIKWLIDGTDTEYKLKDKPRHQFSAETTIKAQYSKDVIPQEGDTKPEGTPDDFVKVTFVPTENGTMEGAKIFWVNPEKKVTIPVENPVGKTYYSFKEWKIGDVTSGETYKVGTAKKFETATTITATYKESENIIPYNPKEPKERPDGYVRVTFEAEDGIKLKEQKAYYVKINAGITLGDTKLAKPGYEAQTGYKFDKWDQEDTTEIEDQDIVVKAKAQPIADVIPKTTEDESEKPDGYITVTFVKGKHGKELTGQAVYYVNPNKAVVLKDKAPTAVPNTGYKFARWDISIDQAIQYKDGAKITALYNDPDNISTTEVEGYVKVEFRSGNNGSLEGTQNYWIKPGVEVNIPAPTVKPNVGYKFDKWDEKLTVNLPADSPTYEITAKYEELNDIIPQKNSDESDKPKGYVKVIFKADDNGSLSGNTVYYVNPEKKVDLTDTANGITKKPNTGYTEKGGSWDPTITEKKYDADETTYTFNFKKLDDVIPADGTAKQPEGYVKVTLIPTDKATDPTNKVYYVNPKVTVTLPNADPIGKNFKDSSNNDFNYNFVGWKVTKGTIKTWEKTGEEKVNITDQFIQDTEITAKYNMKQGTIIARPVPKENVITPQGTVPNPEDLIKNIYDKTNPDNKNNLPDNSKITYESTPDVNNPGKITAKVKVEYPDGNTVVVEVPITVTNDIIEEHEGQEPNVPEGYVMVVVDTTDNATDNTYFKRIFWVNPKKEVKLPIKSPTGKDNYKFKEWKFGLNAEGEAYNPSQGKKFENETNITATYVEKTKASDIQVDDGEIITTPLIVDQGTKVDTKNYELIPNDGRTIDTFDVIQEPVTSQGDKYTVAKIKVKFTDGSTADTKVLIYVRKPCDQCPAPNPGDNPGGGGYIPIPDPNPTLPDEGDDEKEPEDKEKTPDEEKNKEKDPEKDKEKTPEKPGEKDPKEPGENQPPVKNKDKKQGQTGTKIVKTINQTGTKVINQVKNFLNPTTGIISNYGLYIGLMAASSVGLFFTRDKKNEDEE